MEMPRRTNPFLVKNNTTREVLQDLKTALHMAMADNWRGFGMFFEDGHMKMHFRLSGSMKYNKNRAHTAAEQLRRMIFNRIEDEDDVK